jgi:hypothetical protein
MSFTLTKCGPWRRTCLLRPLQETDVDNLLEISLMNPKPGNSLIKANGKENLINYIQLAVKAREKQNSLYCLR